MTQGGDTAVEHHHVAIALIHHHGRWLVQQRGDGGHLAGAWEFPGGKVEPGESVESALHREVAEEVGIAVTILRPAPPVDHDYGDRRVTLHPFLCAPATGEAVGREGQPLCWLTVEEIARLEIPAANQALLSEMEERPGTE